MYCDVLDPIYEVHDDYVHQKNIEVTEYKGEQGW